MLNFSPLLCDGSNGLVCILFSDVLVCSITNYFYLRVVPEQLVKNTQLHCPPKASNKLFIIQLLILYFEATGISVKLRWQ